MLLYVYFSFLHWVKFFSGCFRQFFFIQETKEWLLVALDRCSSYTVTIVWEFAWAGSALSYTSGRLIEVVIWTGLTVIILIIVIDTFEFSQCFFYGDEHLHNTVCIGVSAPLKNTTPLFLAKALPLKSTNCPSPPLFRLSLPI